MKTYPIFEPVKKIEIPINELEDFHLKGVKLYFTAARRKRADPVKILRQIIKENKDELFTISGSYSYKIISNGYGEMKRIEVNTGINSEPIILTAKEVFRRIKKL